MIARLHDITTFLAASGWGGSDVRPLAGDASARRYFRIIRGASRAVLMDTPKGSPDDPTQFLRIAAHLAGLGLSPPKCLAQDLQSGFLLLEDLGDELFARVMAADPAMELPLYYNAIEALHCIQSSPAPAGLPDLGPQDWANAAMLAVTRYAAAVTGAMPDHRALQDALAAALSRHADGPRVLILRDFHAENLLHLPDRRGPARVGLLDFQLGQMGQPCYDLVSLLQDARRDVPLAVQQAVFARARDMMDINPSSYAVFGAQRALRILGIFAQLCTQFGKASYVDLIPRVWGQLHQNLAHPALADVAKICSEILPPPSQPVLETLRSQCNTFR